MRRERTLLQRFCLAVVQQVRFLTHVQDLIKTIYSCASALVCGNLMYHTACVLLLDAGDIVGDDSPIVSNQISVRLCQFMILTLAKMSVKCHSGRAISIAMSNKDEYVISFSLFQFQLSLHTLLKQMQNQPYQCRALCVRSSASYTDRFSEDRRGKLPPRCGTEHPLEDIYGMSEAAKIVGYALNYKA
jgi:hypothetical protein